MDHSLVTGLAAVCGLMVLVWIASLVRRDASIVDIFWGAAFVLLAWLWAFTDAGGAQPRRTVVLACVTVWGLRLSIHIFLRSRGKGEDPRYRSMRERWGESFRWVSLFTVFLLQAILLWVVAWPVHAALQASRPEQLTILDLAGLALFVIGFLFEAVGDAQLARFKSDPDNRGRVLTHGLWRYTRHPNYFGDAVVWWGLTLFAVATGALWVLLSPVLMTVLLMRVSGVTLLESSMRGRPGYEDYMRRTSAFFPWFPRDDDARG